jgi:hypothetical protein
VFGGETVHWTVSSSASRTCESSERREPRERLRLTTLTMAGLTIRTMGGLKILTMAGSPFSPWAG